MMINDVFLKFGWWSWFWWHFLFLHCKIASILVIYDRMFVLSILSALWLNPCAIPEGMQLSVKEEVKHQIRLIVNWISLLFTKIFLRFFKPYFSDLPGSAGQWQGEVSNIYALRAPLAVCNKFELKVAPSGWIELKRGELGSSQKLKILLLRQSQMLLSDMTLDVTCASARWPDCACARMLSSARMFSSVRQGAC